jgi:hypothetical protein
VYDAERDIDSKGGRPMGSSELVIYNAKSMKPCARLKLPQRVPYGIHSLFASAGDLPVKQAGNTLQSVVAALQAELAKVKAECAQLRRQVAGRT